ncbi:hypothetical protein CRG98_010103 [Punica granatum]|uniref:Uncharacterized protein n=1 Tax=Punica granatum TaxID=22663 RepID=A0A2I0KMD4_PUNGR|nr:hypothetical protein CRG98_010103 [Punica granatum]
MSQRSSRVPSLRLGREFPRFDHGLDVSLTLIRATSHHGMHVIRTCNMVIDVRFAWEYKKYQTCMHFGFSITLTPHNEQTSKILTSLSRRGVLPSLGVRGKESGKWREGRVTLLGVTGDGTREQWQRQLGGKEVGTMTPTTARCEVGLLRLLRDGSRRS